MRNMAFSMTTHQMRDHSKTVTRRCGWWFLKAGDLVQAVEKGMGLHKGEHVTPLGVIRVTSVRPEPLCVITTLECVREGFPKMSPAEFVVMFANSHHCERNTVVNRIEFEFVG